MARHVRQLTYAERIKLIMYMVVPRQQHAPFMQISFHSSMALTPITEVYTLTCKCNTFFAALPFIYNHLQNDCLVPEIRPSLTIFEIEFSEDVKATTFSLNFKNSCKYQSKPGKIVIPMHSTRLMINSPKYSFTQKLSAATNRTVILYPID